MINHTYDRCGKKTCKFKEKYILIRFKKPISSMQSIVQFSQMVICHPKYQDKKMGNSGDALETIRRSLLVKTQFERLTQGPPGGERQSRDQTPGLLRSSPSALPLPSLLSGSALKSKQRLGFSSSLVAYGNEILVGVIKRHLGIKPYKVFGADELENLTTFLPSVREAVPCLWRQPSLPRRREKQLCAETSCPLPAGPPAHPSHSITLSSPAAEGARFTLVQ